MMTFGVVDDGDAEGFPPAQVLMSWAEAKAMLRMDGGICWENWLLLRGLDLNGAQLPLKES